AEEDARDGVRREFEMAVGHAVEVVSERYRAERAGDLDDLIAAAHGGGFFGRQGDVAGTVVHRLLRQLRDAGAGAAASVVDVDLAELLVVGKIGGVIVRLGKSGARTGQRGRRWRWYSGAPCRRIATCGTASTRREHKSHTGGKCNEDGLHAANARYASLSLGACQVKAWLTAAAEVAREQLFRSRRCSRRRSFRPEAQPGGGQSRGPARYPAGRLSNGRLCRSVRRCGRDHGQEFRDRCRVL